MNFSAVILAGGKSTRMGRDKARLEIGGQTLLARQIAIARELGAAEIFISGRAGADYSMFHCPVLTDKHPDTGPLAGIMRALEVMSSTLLLVLAVDLPAMSPELLRRLSAGAAESFGAIPKLKGSIEPLAAFYPKIAASLLKELLHSNRPLTPALSRGERENLSPSPGKYTTDNGGNYFRRPEDAQPLSPLPGGEGQGEGEHTIPKSPGAKHFAELCVESGFACFVELGETDERHFANWNSPADFEPATRKSCSIS